ncbi:hypothetical protein N601_20930 [Rhodococcus erythropolis DN1]|nr:hypothetical protein N601_20930 [Rhodococcus erythropolis DN1]
MTQWPIRSTMTQWPIQSTMTQWQVPIRDARRVHHHRPPRRFDLQRAKLPGGGIYIPED